MARMCDDIKTIDGSKETLKLGVRIISLWDCGNRDRNIQVEMVVMDCKGDKIQVVVRKDEVETWKEKLFEGKTYFMHNFKVVSNEGQYRVCEHPFKLLFTSGTIIIESDVPSIPVCAYAFKDFGAVISGDYRQDLLVDFIGAVHNITYNGLKNIPRKIVFHLIDLSGNCLNCTLWEEYAVRFMECYNNRPNDQSFVIILTRARIKQAQGVFPVLISNSFYASKLIINEKIPEIEQFKESFTGVSQEGKSQDSQASISLSSISPLEVSLPSVGSCQQAGWTEFSEEDKFMYKAPVKTLAEINVVSKESIFVTVGTTVKFVVGPHGWYYESCSRCNKKAEKVDEPFTCHCGCYNEKSYPRYKLEVEVYYNKQSSKFAFFDRDCSYLIGMNALELRKMMIEAGEPDDARLYPEPLDRLLGCTMAFRVKVHPKFNNCSVLRMSADAKLVKSIIKQFPCEPDMSTSDKDAPAVNLAAVSDTQQSLSRTAEHDPDVSISVTPAKRQTIEMESADVLTPDTSSVQKSSTKMCKHIKIE